MFVLLELNVVVPTVCATGANVPELLPGMLVHTCMVCVFKLCAHDAGLVLQGRDRNSANKQFNIQTD